MSVVINDFEIVVTPPEEAGKEQASAAPPPQSQAVTPLKIDRIVRRRKQRKLRLCAH